MRPEPSRQTEQGAKQGIVSRFLTQPAVRAASKFAVQHPAAARRFRFVVSRVPIVSKFLTFLVPATLELATPAPCPVEIKQAADSLTTPPLRPRFNRPSGPRF